MGLRRASDAAVFYINVDAASTGLGAGTARQSAKVCEPRPVAHNAVNGTLWYRAGLVLMGARAYNATVRSPRTDGTRPGLLAAAASHAAVTSLGTPGRPVTVDAVYGAMIRGACVDFLAPQGQVEACVTTMRSLSHRPSAGFGAAAASHSAGSFGPCSNPVADCAVNGTGDFIA